MRKFNFLTVAAALIHRRRDIGYLDHSRECCRISPDRSISNDDEHPEIFPLSKRWISAWSR